jgi:Zn-finger nucleic acid-binding protein
VDLVEKKLGSSALLACLKCGGVWLDSVACETIAHRGGYDHPSTERAGYLLFLADRSAEQATVQPDESIALCPVCLAPMQRTPVAAVEVSIDICRHGTWFDANELRVFVRSLRSAQTSLGAISRPAATEDGIVLERSVQTSRGAIPRPAATEDGGVLEVIGGVLEGIGALLDLLSLFGSD